MTPDRHRLPPTIVIRFLAALLVAGVVAGCASDEEGDVPPRTGPPPARPLVPENQIFDYRFIETRSGTRQWILESAEMLKYPGQEDMVLVDLKMDFYRSGAYHSTLTADSGRANELTHNVHAWGDVVVVTEDGRKLETEELFFDNEREIIHNDVFDRLTRDGDVVTGIGLEASPDLEYIELKDNVQAEVGDETPETPESSEGGAGDR